MKMNLTPFLLLAVGVAIICGVLLLFRTIASFVAYWKLDRLGTSPNLVMLPVPGYLWRIYGKSPTADDSLRKLLHRIAVADAFLLVSALLLVALLSGS